MSYRALSFTCRVCEMTSYHPEDVKHGYCGNCREFTGNELGFVAAVLRRMAGLATVSMEHATHVLRNIKSTGNTLDSWKGLVETAVAEQRGRGN